MDIITSNIIPLHGAASTMTGGRPENQDDLGWTDTPLGFLLVVCDGMGGGPGGKTASYIAKYVVMQTLLESAPSANRAEILKKAVGRAHEALEKKMNEMPALVGMGSTIVAMLINDYSVVVAHAGDSRCYRLHGKRCLYRSQDHSLVAELVRKKALTEEEARKSPQSNVITRGLGSTNNQVPDIDEMPYRKGDRFIICTDGVWGVMPHNDLLKIFTSKSVPSQLVNSLSSEVDQIGFSQGGHHDNHTIAVIDMDRSSTMKDKANLRKWMIISAAACVIAAIIALLFWIWIIFKPQKTNAVLFGTSSPTYVQPTDNQIGYSPTSSESQKTVSDGNNSGSKPADAPDVSDEGTGNLTNAEEEPKNDIINTIKKKLEENSAQKESSATSQKPPQPKDNQPDNQTEEKKEEPHPSDSEVAVQKIINRYQEAKNIKGKTEREAAEKLDKYHQTIKDGMANLCEILNSSQMLYKCEAIERQVDNPSTWYVCRDLKSKNFIATPTAQKIMDEQIKRLTELKSAIVEEEKENKKN